MRLRYLVPLFMLVTVSLPATAEAQTREPHALSLALGGDVGFFVPDEEFHTGFTPAVYGEFYLLPRISVRLLAAWSRNEFIDQQDLFLEQFRESLNVVWNWDADLWHPFVTGGVSAHTVRVYRDDVLNSGWSSEIGYNLGVGVEYFARPKLSIKAEGTYYMVSEDLPKESSGFALSIGFKRYF